LNKKTKNQEADDRIVVPPGDPFVRQSSKNLTISSKPKKSSILEINRQLDIKSGSQKLREHRRKSIVIGGMFAALAFLLYFGFMATSPKLIVHLKGGEGTVLIDGNIAGKTGERIENLTIGRHIVKVITGDSNQIVMPEQKEIDLTYGLKLRAIGFKIIDIQNLRNNNDSPLESK